MGLRSDRVRSRTAEAVLRRIDEQTEERLHREAAAGPESMARRLGDLDREWDIDRAITAEAAMTGLAGLALGTAVDRRFLGLPAVVGGMLVLYALRGWYPLLPVLRRAGLRTPREISRERFALKALRGDFSDFERGTRAVPTPDSGRGDTGAADARLGGDRR